MTYGGNWTNFPQGFANGISVRGMPLLQSQPGQVFYVSNNVALNPGQHAGSDSSRGTFLDPFATLAHALAMCVADRGDIIFVGAGHAETISSATALTLSTDAVAIIGLGGGSYRPTFTLDTGTTSTINVTGDSISIQNCVFIANFANIVSLFTLTTALNFAVDNCEVRDTSSILNFLSVVTTDATSNHADGLSITGSTFLLKATSGAVTLVVPAGTNDRWLISGNYFTSATTNAGAVIPIATGKVLTNMRVLNNRWNLVNAAATATGYLITTNGTTNSGFIDGNIDHCLANTTYLNSLLVTASSGFVFGQNWHSRTADKSPGVVLPAADS